MTSQEAAAPPTAQTALVVYDAAGIRYLLRRMLERKGLEVVEARTAKYAQIAASGRKVSLIVLDFHLPDDDGLSLGQKLRRLHPDSVILLTSAQTQPQAGLEHPAIDGFIPQPFDATTLDLIQGFLGVRRREG